MYFMTCIIILCVLMLYILLSTTIDLSRLPTYHIYMSFLCFNMYFVVLEDNVQVLK